MLKLISQDPEDTRALGKLLGQLLDDGDVILLSGPLGAGKTTLVKGIAQALGIRPEEVVSPTFTLIAEYHGRITLYHVDLYRLERPEEVLDLGLTDYLYSPSGAVAIEWADRLPEGLVDDALKLTFNYAGDDCRSIAVEAYGPRSLVLLEGLRSRAVGMLGEGKSESDGPGKEG